MRTKVVVAATVIAGASLASANLSATAGVAARYSAHLLPAPTQSNVEYSHSVVVDANAAGQIAGFRVETVAGNSRSFLLVGSIKAPRSIPMSAGSLVRVSDSGVVANINYDEPGRFRVVWVSPDGSVSHRGMSDVDVSSASIGADGRTSVVVEECPEGTSPGSATCTSRIEVVSNTGQRTTIATFPSGERPLITDRNGSTTIGVVASAPDYPVRSWSDSGEVHEYERLGLVAIPFAIASDGSAVGASAADSSPITAVRWSPDGSASLLSTPAGNESIAFDVADDGTAVGYFAGYPSYQPAAWTGTTLIDLTARLRCGAPSENAAVTAIRDDGALAGGTARPDGSMIGALWTPATPLTSLLQPLTCPVRNAAATHRQPLRALVLHIIATLLDASP